METIEVSPHLCKVFCAVKAAPDWVTAKAVAASTGVAERTVRLHLSRLAEAGVLEQAMVFSGYRYHLAAQPDKTARAMLLRLGDASKVFGLD